MMAPTKMKLRMRKKEKGSAKSSQRQRQPLRPETSPDSKCPICLDRFVNVASVERCLHRFCFRCIREWAKNKAECPLCKQPFRSIFHSVRAENDFKEFVVLEDNAQNATTSASAAVTITAAAIAAAPAGHADTEGTATHTLRSRATRTRQRRSQRAQDPAPSASSMDGVALDHAVLMQRDPACLRQLLPWLRRERVMGANPSELRPFLLARTDHILHELVSFARSIEAMQCPPTPSYEEDSGSQSSIINISEDDDDSEGADITENTTQEPVLPVPMATSSEISLSQSAWDDETPGPSYSTLGHSQTEEVEPEGNQLGGTSAASEQREHNNDNNDEEDECMIVGYVKPMAERTPELVQLSSDSTEEEDGNEAAATKTEVKAESSVPSHEQAPISPKPYPSTSHTQRGENLEESQEQGSGNPSHPRRQEHTPRRCFRKPSHSLSGSHSHTSSESSPPSGNSVKICRSRIRLSSREPRTQGHHLLGRSPTVFAERDGSSSEELVPTRSIPARDKSSKSFSPWDSPGHDGERKRKRRKRRREREIDRSRSPHWESRHLHGDQELWLRSSSSDAESRQEKPAGKRKYKTRHLERTARRRSKRKSRDRERETERSPSVEIIFERRASDTHTRGRRHKKRSRRKERAYNSPSIITIDSDSSSLHAADSQNHHMEANAHTADSQNHHSEANRHTAEFQSRYTDANSYATDSQDRCMKANSHAADSQNRLTKANSHATDSQSRRTKANSHSADSQNRRTKANSHAADSQNRLTKANSNAADSQNQLMRNDKCNIANDHSLDYRDQYAYDSERVTDFSDHTIDYQEHLSAFSDRTTDDKDCVTDSRNRTTDYKDHTGDENSVAMFNERTAEYNDGVAGVSSQTTDYDDKLAKVGDSSTYYKHGVQNASDRTDEHEGHAAGVSSLAADYTHSGVQVNSNSADFSLAKPRHAGVNAHTAEYQQSLWDHDNDFQDSITDLRDRGKSSVSVLDILNLEHCLVDVVQPDRRVDGSNYGAATPLTDTRLLELEDSLLGEGQGTSGSVTVDQQEAWLVANRDQSGAEVEMVHTDVTRDSGVSAEMSPDV